MTPEHIYKQVMTKQVSHHAVYVSCMFLASTHLLASLYNKRLLSIWMKWKHNGTVRRDVLLLLRLMLFRIRKRYCALLN